MLPCIFSWSDCIVIEWLIMIRRSIGIRIMIISWSIKILILCCWWWWCRWWWWRRRRRSLMMIIGSLSNGDGNETGKKAIGLDWQNNNFARPSRFSLPSLHDNNVKVPNLTFCRGREHRQQLSFSFPELWYSPLEFNFQKICQNLTN